MSEYDLEQAITSGIICALQRDQEKGIFQFVTVDVPATAVLAVAQGVSSYDAAKQSLLDQTPKLWDLVDKQTVYSIQSLLEEVPLELRGQFMMYGLETAIAFWQDKLNQSVVNPDVLNIGSKRLNILEERHDPRRLAEFMERSDLLQGL